MLTVKPVAVATGVEKVGVLAALMKRTTTTPSAPALPLVRLEVLYAPFPPLPLFAVEFAAAQVVAFHALPPAP
jgi:hypothetical protein